MQPIGDYIKKLLYQYDCIVVPGLGGFLTHSVSASFQESTGLFLPPRRQVAFNGALVLDDGILLTYLMLHERISRDDAMRAMQSFVQMLTQQVRQSGSFRIDGLGMFTHNAEEKLQFEPELRLNFMASTYGMQPVSLPGRIIHLAQPIGQPALQPVRATPVVTPALVATYPAVVTAALTQPEPDDLMPLPTRSPAVGWRWVAAAALLVGSLGLISYLSLQGGGAPFQSSLNPATLLLPSVESSMPLPAGQSTSPSVVTTPVIPASAVVATPAGDSRVVAADRPAVLETAPGVSANRADRSVTKAVTAPGTSTKPAVPVVMAVPLVRPPFTLIAGSFASRRNAVRFQKRLVRAGYEDASIITGGSLIKVAATSAATYGEAAAGVDSLRALTRIKPWIMRNP